MAYVRSQPSHKITARRVRDSGPRIRSRDAPSANPASAHGTSHPTWPASWPSASRSAPAGAPTKSRENPRRGPDSSARSVEPPAGVAEVDDPAAPPERGADEVDPRESRQYDERGQHLHVEPETDQRHGQREKGKL